MNCSRILVQNNRLRQIANSNCLKYSAIFSISRSITSQTETYKESKVKVGSYEINYVKAGNGDHKVLCMPGALGSAWTDFKPQIEGLNKDEFTVLAWDPPGYGKSRPPNRDFPVDFYENDSDAAHYFMEALNIPKYSILGWSDGGISGLIMAAKYSKSIRKLVIWGSNAFILKSELEYYDKIKDVSNWSPRMKQPMVDLYGEKYFVETWVNWIEGVKNLYRARNGDICKKDLKEITCPVFILHGEKDPMIDNSHVSYLHTNIPTSCVHLYPDGKHNIHLRYAEDFNQKVETFLLKSKKT